jgi:hypothetical protein
MRWLIAFVVVVALGCAKKDSPEAQIKKVIDDGIAGLEDRDADKAAETLADDYADKSHRTKKQLKQLAFFALQQGPLIVAVQDEHVHVDGDTGTVELHLLAVQGNAQLKSASDLLPSNAKTFALTLHFAKQGSVWKVSSIDGLGGAAGLE